MTPELITRLIGLIQKTGDRVVLADPATGRAVVVMDLEQYERLCVPSAVQVVPAPAPVQTPVFERTETPAPARPTAPKMEVEIPKKIAKQSDNPFQKRGRQLGVETAPKIEGLHDLTQEQLLDKINRDIGDWKTAQERKRTDELKAVAQGATARFEAANVMEEEERFYLEPIE